MATKYAHPTLGFGVPDIGGPHHYRVNIPPRINESVLIVEVLSDLTGIIPRASLERARWNAIDGFVMRAFNKRLKEQNLSPGRWKRAENPVDRLLGKELCVLAWAIEEANPEQIGLAVRNWLALRPEDRWWLFGMAARDSGQAQDEIKGWRKALGVALAGSTGGRS